MKRSWIVVPVLLLLAMLVFMPAPALAQGGRPVFGEPVTIENGEKFDGDLVVFGGPITVKRGGEVNGDVVAVGGPVSIAGRAEGDVVAIGGPVSLHDSAVVGGDVVSVGGPVSRAAGADVQGDVVEGFRFGDLRFLPFSPNRVPEGLPAGPAPQIEWRSGSGFLSFLRGLFTDGLLAVGLALIALLLISLMPEQVNTVKQMSADQPIASTGVGCLTLVVAALVMVALAITLCGIPIAAILGIVLAIAGVFGWIAVGFMVGERLLAALNTERPLPMISAVVGVLLITLLALLVPCLGPVFSLVGLSWGLGAVVLSRGGTRSFPSLPGGWSPASLPTPPVAPLPPADAERAPESGDQPVVPPAGPSEMVAEDLDDLQAIMGIGPVYERMLDEAGIRTYANLASRSPQELAEIVAGPDVIPVSVDAAQTWIDQARQLAEEQNQ